MSVLSLLALSSMLVASIAYPVRLTVVDGRYPNFDTCDAVFNLGYIEVAPAADNLEDFLTPCVYGTMNVGDTFRVDFVHMSDIIISKNYAYEGSETGFGKLKDVSIQIEDLSQAIHPSSPTALVEIVTVILYRNDETVALGSFDIQVARVVQAIGESNQAFAVLSQKPSKWKKCLSDSSDISSVVAVGSPFWVCVVFYNPICPTNAFPEAQTTFVIDVQGNDGGLIVDLTPSTDLDPYTCNTELISKPQTYRFVKITNYGSLDSIDVTAAMYSFGQSVEVSGDRTF